MEAIFRDENSLPEDRYLDAIFEDPSQQVDPFNLFSTLTSDLDNIQDELKDYYFIPPPNLDRDTPLPTVHPVPNPDRDQTDTTC